MALLRRRRWAAPGNGSCREEYVSRSRRFPHESSGKAWRFFGRYLESAGGGGGGRGKRKPCREHKAFPPWPHKGGEGRGPAGAACGSPGAWVAPFSEVGSSRTSWGWRRAAGPRGAWAPRSLLPRVRPVAAAPAATSERLAAPASRGCLAAPRVSECPGGERVARVAAAFPESCH